MQIKKIKNGGYFYYARGCFYSPMPCYKRGKFARALKKYICYPCNNGDSIMYLSGDCEVFAVK
jgi:hypothetical protein